MSKLKDWKFGVSKVEVSLGWELGVPTQSKTAAMQIGELFTLSLVKKEKKVGIGEWGRTHPLGAPLAFPHLKGADDTALGCQSISF